MGTHLARRATTVSAGAAMVAIVAATALYSQVAPYVGFLDLARTAVPGLALAAGAAAVALLGRGGYAPVLLLAASLSMVAPALGIGLQQRSSTWSPIVAAGGLLASLVVAIASTFPDGRLRGRAARAVVVIALAVGVALMVARALTYDPAAWGWCRCVANPLAVGIDAGSYLDLVDVLTVAGMGVLVGGMVVVLRPRRGRSDLAFAAVVGVLITSWLLLDAWALLSSTSPPDVVVVIRDAALVLTPVVYTVGHAAQRPSRAHVADLLIAAREVHDPDRLRSLVGRAIGDPQAELAWWDPAANGFRDTLGRPIVVPARGALVVEAAGRPIALVVSEGIDSVDPGVRESVAEALLLSGENRRLTAELQASLEQVRDSRSRILTASDETRRRIERDLHDGAQQLLISTGIKLNLAAAQAGRNDAQDLAGVLEEAQLELSRAVTELRNLAGGITPTALVHGSLDNALRELALRSAVPTTVRVTGDLQPDEPTAATVYFVVAECLTNVAKHSGASRATVEVELGDPVRIAVTDDGHGRASLDGTGTGLRGMVDRVEARGGRLDLASDASGTSVCAVLPANLRAKGDP
jgi:signal transduction histidine kinase